MSTNPYAAPRAQVVDATVVPRGNFLPTGRSVPAGNGWTWITAAWQHFRARAGLWMGMVVVATLIMVGLMVIPFIGPLAQSLLWPVFVAGFAIASRKIDEGESAQFGDLFAGFSQRAGALIATGLIAMLISAAIVFAAIAVVGTAAFAGFSGTATITPAQMMAFLLASLVILALMLPLIMALWFAPPLIVFHEMGAWEAMKASFFGGIKNMLPFLLYGIVLTIASVLASIPALLGWLVLGPVIAASIYTSYRDIYFSEA
jgi:uncharacterized membrane protein